MMPWTADRVSLHQPLCERATIVRTRCTDGEHLATAPRQEHCLAISVTKAHCAIRQLRQRHAHFQIGTRQGRWRLSHGCTLRCGCRGNVPLPRNDGNTSASVCVATSALLRELLRECVLEMLRGHQVRLKRGRDLHHER